MVVGDGLRSFHSRAPAVSNQDGSHLRRNAAPYAVASGIPHPQTKKRTCVMTQALKFQNGGGGWTH